MSKSVVIKGMTDFSVLDRIFDSFLSYVIFFSQNRFME